MNGASVVAVSYDFRYLLLTYTVSPVIVMAIDADPLWACGFLLAL